MNSIMKWVGLAGAILTVLGFGATVLWYFENDRVRQTQWLRDDVQWNEELHFNLSAILARQEQIQRELATQTLRLDSIEDNQANLRDAIATSNDDLNYRLGFHRGAQEEL